MPFPGSAKPIGKLRRCRSRLYCRCWGVGFPFHVSKLLSLFICISILSERISGKQANHMKFCLGYRNPQFRVVRIMLALPITPPLSGSGSGYSRSSLKSRWRSVTPSEPICALCSAGNFENRQAAACSPRTLNALTQRRIVDASAAQTEISTLLPASSFSITRSIASAL